MDEPWVEYVFCESPQVDPGFSPVCKSTPRAHASKPPTTSTQAAMDTCFIEDQDLTGAEFDDLVCSGRVPVVVVLLTEYSFSSVSQLFRLGHIHKYSNPRSRKVPVAIKDAFSFPSKEVLDGIENGTRLMLHKSVDDTALALTGKKVSLPRVTAALMEALQTTVSLLDLSHLETEKIRVVGDKVCERIVAAAVDYKTLGKDGDGMNSSPSIFAGKSSARDSNIMADGQLLIPVVAPPPSNQQEGFEDEIVIEDQPDKAAIVPGMTMKVSNNVVSE